jgi:hypothetical protein
MGDELYVGHEKQLLHLVEELRPRTADSRLSTPPTLLLHILGAPGSGRKTLIRRTWGEIAKGETPRVLFTIRATDENLTDRILSDAVANRSYLQETLETITGEINAQSKRLAEAGRPLPDEARLTLWSDLVEQKLVDDPRNNRDLQLVFALTDFLAFPPPMRETIARAIPRANAPVDCRLIVTGQNGTKQEELLRYFPERTPLEEVPLLPLTVDEVEQWLQEKKLPVDFATEVYKRCKGMPGRLESSAAEVAQEQQERMLIIMAEGAMKDAPDSLYPALCSSAVLPEITHQTLQILMTNDEAAATMQFLRRCDWQESGWRGNAFVAGAQIRQALVKYMMVKFKPVYAKVAPIAQEFSKIHAIIPGAPLRDALVRLSQFNYFNEALLKEIIPAEAEKLVAAVKENPACFENTGSNYKIKADARQATEAYIKLAKINVPAEEKTRIAAAWEARRRKIMEQMTSSEEKVRRDTATLSALQGQLKQIVGNIDSELDKINRLRRKSQRKAQEAAKPHAPSRGLQIGRLAMQGLGTVIIYISILISTKTSLLYAALGVGLIIGGLFVKGGMLAPVRAPMNPGQISTVDIEKHERNLHFLNIKRNQMESRQNSTAVNIAKEKSALKEFDKQLREPYS